MPRRAAFVLLAVLTAALPAGCTAPVPPTPSGSQRPPSGQAASGVAAPSASPVNSLTQPGRPYDAAAILAAMRGSRRPGGVPAAVQTDEVASAVAESIWTWDGDPWRVIAVGGSCGPASCLLDVAGSPAASAGADLYSFSVDPDGGSVELLTADLHGYPAALDARLDEVARAGIDPVRLADLALVGARWLPPPEAGRYWLAYRSGGEEGAPGLDVLVDLEAGEVLSIDELG